MYYKKILILLICYNVSNVLCKSQSKIPCALDDLRCTTSVAASLFKKIVNGLPDIGVPTSDPVHQEVIFGFVRDVNYTLTDGSMYGIKNCEVKKLIMFPHDLTWTFTLRCPRLVLQSVYEISGFLGGHYIEGKGPCKTTDDDYHMVLCGGFEYFTGVDGKSRIKVTYFDFDQLEVLGRVKYELHNLYHGDEVKSQKMHKYLNENWKSVSATTHYPALYGFMGKMLDNLNIFLRVVPHSTLNKYITEVYSTED